MLRTLLATLAATVLASTVHAQSLPAGTRARVYRAGHMPLTGRVADPTPQGFALDSAGPDGSRVVLRYDEIQSLERSDGLRNHALLGGGIGLAAGAALTALFLHGFCGTDSPCQGDEVVKAGAVFALPPTVAGLVIGALIRSERWVPVAAPRVAVQVGSGRVGIGIGLRF